MFFWGHPQFYGVREQAANIGWQTGNYTEAMFQEDYPPVLHQSHRGIPCLAVAARVHAYRVYIPGKFQHPA